MASVYPTSEACGKDRLENFYKDIRHNLFGVTLKEDNLLNVRVYSLLRSEYLETLQLK